MAARAIASTSGVRDAARYASCRPSPCASPRWCRFCCAASTRPQRPTGRTWAARSPGHLADLTPGSGRILGAIIAERLGLSAGDSITVLLPTVSAGGAPTPKLREFTVAGVFEVGLQDHDGTLVFAHLEDVRALGAGSVNEGLRVRVDNVLAAPAVAASLRQRPAPDFAVRDRMQENANYFGDISVEKTMMSLILLLIVAVAAFNIVAMLVMVVTDKRNRHRHPCAPSGRARAASWASF
jgi:ABC-type lipoprotein release transport system permease subunit